MKIEVEFAELKALVKKMGAKPVNWDSEAQKAPPPDFAKRLEEGIDLKKLDDVVPAENGLLTYKDEQVLLYIKDHGHMDRDKLLNSPKDARRFHVADCVTLDDMRQKKKFDRYVVTTRKDGSFEVDYFDDVQKKTVSIESKLRACMNCLKMINYQEYEKAPKKQQRKIWNAFDLREFFKIYATFFRNRPPYTDKTFPSGIYEPDWPEISKKYRDAADWKCQNTQCGVDLSAHKRLLDVHHISGNKRDNYSGNLKVLCKECHRNQPFHSHYKVRDADLKLIGRVRRKQRLTNPNPVN